MSVVIVVFGGRYAEKSPWSAESPISPVVLSPSPSGGVVTDAIAPPDETETTDDVNANLSVPPEPPPPVSIQPMTAQRLRRVDFYPAIGDINRIVYDTSQRVLFMAVVEPNGMRSVFSLTSDLQMKRLLSFDQSPGEIFLGQDSTGVLFACFANPGTLFRSIDLGVTWEKVADGLGGAFWQIADDGRGTVWGAMHAWNKAIVYRSTDSGRTWHEWKDFQKIYPEYAVTYAAGDDRFKLRHLHAVSYVNGKLFVGVGDVARFTVMSDDGGETWKQIWSEGYTASATLADGSGMLLGPDRLQAHGIAHYDFGTGKTTEVWSPIPYGYAGYTYSMLEIEGDYFAAFHTETNEVEWFSGKSGIVVSPDGRKWYPFLEFDALTNWARTDIFMSKAERFSGYVTLNGALYLFEPPIGRWFEIHKAFGE
jgi:hypothetical protein